MAEIRGGCLYTEPGLDAGLNFSLSRHFHVLTIRRRVFVAIMEGKLELGLGLGLGLGLVVGLGGYELG